MKYKDLEVGSHFEFVVDGTDWGFIKIDDYKVLRTKTPFGVVGMVINYIGYHKEFDVRLISPIGVSLDNILRHITPSKRCLRGRKKSR